MFIECVCALCFHDIRRIVVCGRVSSDTAVMIVNWSHDQNLFTGSKRQHGRVQSRLIVSEVHLGAGRSCELPLPDQGAQLIHHGSECSPIYGK